MGSTCTLRAFVLLITSSATHFIGHMLNVLLLIGKYILLIFFNHEFYVKVLCTVVKRS